MSRKILPANIFRMTVTASTALVTLALSACLAVDIGRQSDSETSTDPDLIEAAIAFGGIALPDDSSVLLAHTEKGIDTFYSLSISTTPEGLTELLESSHFTKKLAEDFPPYPSVPAGPDLTSSPSVISAQDTYKPAKGSRITRNIIVDERDANTRIVHLELFET